MVEQGNTMIPKREGQMAYSCRSLLSKRSKRQCDLRDVRVEIELAASGRRFTFDGL
jgi:hypothetical protein